ncbi:glycosyltransferase [Metabacillus dongyingensis]|uniref:glycosyltransferase n=1 Tax=Metabacillus dongyingensis TaxID=2874282 RepID=UPI003B8C77FC
MKKKIMFIIPTLSNGGAQRTVANLTKGLPQDYEIFVVIYHKTKEQYEYNGTLICLDSEPSKTMIGKLSNILKRVRKIKRLKKTLNVDLSVSLLDNPNLTNILSRAHEKVVVSIRNQQSKEFSGIKKVIHKFAVKHIYSRADKIVAISNGVQKDLLDEFDVQEEKIKVIYNPVDIKRINELKLEPIEKKYQSLFNKKHTVITVGRLAHQKGQWHLIRAFKSVVNEIPDINLIIIGEGPYEDRLKILIKELNLENNIKLIGFKENPFKFIFNSDIFILPSLFEGLGNVILEAMVCGTPIISTDCESGPKEILAPERNLNSNTEELSISSNGILIPVPSGDSFNSKEELSFQEKAMSEAILLLLKNKGIVTELKENNKKRVQEFSFNSIVNQWIELGDS